jgi:hypothetical protein
MQSKASHFIIFLLWQLGVCSKVASCDLGHFQVEKQDEICYKTLVLVSLQKRHLSGFCFLNTVLLARKFQCIKLVCIVRLLFLNCTLNMLGLFSRN